MTLSRYLRTLAASAALVAGGAATVVSTPAQAQFGGIVYDPSNYAQNVLTAARTLEQINNQIRMLQNQATSLINQAKNLERLPTSILQPLQDQIRQTQQLLGQAQRIAYDVREIGALQAAQAGNQLLALQARQLADLTATLAASSRAQALDAADRAAARRQAREQLRRFLADRPRYVPGGSD